MIAKQNLESAVEFTTSNSVAGEFFQELPKVSKETQDEDRFTLYTKEASTVLMELTRLSEIDGLTLESISVRKATLEDVFLDMTGRKLRE